MKAKTLIKTVLPISLSLPILLAFSIMGCGNTENPEQDFSKLPGPPPPAPSVITWKAQPRAGLTSSIIFMFSKDPGDIKAADITLEGDTVQKGGLSAVEGNSFQRKLDVTWSAPLTDDEVVTVTIPDYANVESESKEVTIYGTPAYFKVEAIGLGEGVFGGDNTSFLEFTFFDDSGMTSERDIGVLYPADLEILAGSGSASGNRIIGNNEGGPTRTLNLLSMENGTVSVRFISINVAPAASGTSDVTTIKQGPATFWCEVALDEWGEPKGNLLLHFSRRVGTSNIQAINLILTGVTDGPMGVAGAASLTSMSQIDGGSGRTFGLRVTKTGDLVIQWKNTPDADPPYDNDISGWINLDFICEPFTVYK